MVTQRIVDGRSLLVLRTIRGLTQDWVSRTVRITTAKLSSYENGRAAPDLATALAISKAMGFSPAHLWLALSLVELAYRRR